MAEAYDFFSGSQEDINRRLLRKILKLESGIGKIDELESEIGDINTEIGDDTTTESIKGRIKALEDAT